MVPNQNALVGHRILVKIGVRKPGFNEKFDRSYEKYTRLKEYVAGLEKSLVEYAYQITQMAEASRNMSSHTRFLYNSRETGFKTAIAFRNAQDQVRTGHTGRIMQAFVKAVIDIVNDWKHKLDALEHHYADFNEVRLRHDRYRYKVDILRVKTSSLEERAKTHGDGKDYRQAEEKLTRNNKKLDDVTKDYERVVKQATDAMDKACADRLRMMNGITSRIIDFQQAMYAEQLFTVLGVGQIMESEGGTDWADGRHTDAFVTMGNLKHHEGPLLRQYNMVRARHWFRLVGNTLEAYHLKDMEERTMPVLYGEPKERFEVRSVRKIAENRLKVSVISSDGPLTLIAADANDGKEWFQALERASNWDAHSSMREVGRHVERSRGFIDQCQTSQRAVSVLEELHKELGVTAALAGPQSPPSTNTADANGAVDRSEPGGDSAAAGIAPGGGGIIPPQFFGPWDYDRNAVIEAENLAGGAPAAAVAEPPPAPAPAQPENAGGDGGDAANPGDGGNGNGGDAANGGNGNGGNGGDGNGDDGNGGNGNKKKKKGGRGKGNGDQEEKKSPVRMPDLIHADSGRPSISPAAAAANFSAAAQRNVSGTGGLHPRMPSRGDPRGPGQTLGMMGGPPHPRIVMADPHLMVYNMMPNGIVPNRPVAIGPHGPVQVMGAGHAGGAPTPGGTQWDGAGGRGPWNQNAHSSFVNRPGPEGTRPSLQRSKSLGGFSAPFAVTSEEFMLRPTPGAEAPHLSTADFDFDPTEDSGNTGAAAAAATAATAAAAAAAAAGAMAGEGKHAVGDDVGAPKKPSKPSSEKTAATQPPSRRFTPFGPRVVQDVPQTARNRRQRRELRRTYSVGSERTEPLPNDSDDDAGSGLLWGFPNWWAMSKNKRRASGPLEKDAGSKSEAAHGGARTASDTRPPVGAAGPEFKVPTSASVAAAGVAAVGLAKAASAPKLSPAEPKEAAPSPEEKPRLSPNMEPQQSNTPPSSGGEEVPLIATISLPVSLTTQARGVETAASSSAEGARSSPTTDAGAGTSVVAESNSHPPENGGDGGGGGTNFDLTVAAGASGSRAVVSDGAPEATGNGADVDANSVKSNGTLGQAAPDSLAGSLTAAPALSPTPTSALTPAPGTPSISVPVPTLAPISTVPSSRSTSSNGASFSVHSVTIPHVAGVASPPDEGKSTSSSGNASHSEGSSVDATAAQMKVFNRLCVTRGKGGNEAETGDAGGGGGEAGASKSERTLSFDQLMAWDEVQELLEYGALKEEEVRGVWENALRLQDERTIASTAKAHGDIWSAGDSQGSTNAEVSPPLKEPSNALTQRGFTLLVKLIEELQFEKELERERGVSLVGAVRVV